MTVAAIVLAGGRGTRIGSERNKVLIEIAGESMLSRSIRVLARHHGVDQVVVVAHIDDFAEISTIAEHAAGPKLVGVVPGGETRRESELSGLETLSDAIEAGRVDIVAIHDGARPFVSAGLIDRVLGACGPTQGAIPVTPTRARLAVFGLEGVRPIPSGAVVTVQTPQAFPAGPLLAAYRAAHRAGFSGADTAETMERFSDVGVIAVEGEPGNTKITFPEDVTRAARTAAHTPPSV